MPDEVREYVIYIPSSGTHCYALPVIHTAKLRKTGCRILDRAVCTEREAMEAARRYEKELGLPGDRRFDGSERAVEAEQKDKEPKKQKDKEPKKWKKRK